MRIDDRYPVLETLRQEKGATLYRVEGGVVVFFDVRTPEEKEAFYRYARAVRRLVQGGVLQASLSARPGRYYAFFPEGALSNPRPPREVLEALLPLGFGREHLHLGPDQAYLAPWPLGRGRSRRRGSPMAWAPGLLLGVLGLALAYAGFARYLNPPLVQIPDLRGQPIREAFLRVKDLPLVLKVEEGSDLARPKEEVLDQDPAPGTRVRAGRTLRLWVNQVRLAPLPDLAGLKEEEALRRLKELGLEAGRLARVEGDRPLGTVLATYPPAGTLLPPGAQVDLLLSQGAQSTPSFILPDLRGLSLDEALLLLNAAELQVEKEEVPSGAAPGQVLDQDPPPGTPLAPGSGVRLRVAVQGEVQRPEAPPPAPVPAQSTVRLHLNLPPEAQGRQVQLLLLDADGARVIYEGPGQEGLLLEGEYQVRGEARFRLLLDGQLVQEWAP